MEEMKKLLSVWRQDQQHHWVLLNLMLIQEKAKRFYEDLKKKHGEESEDASLNASHSWLHQFKARAKFHNIKISGEAVSADRVAALYSKIPALQEFPEML